MIIYYALFDTQLDGYRAGFVNTDLLELEGVSADWVYEMSLSDDEPCDPDMGNKEILEDYGYEIREVTKEEYEKISDGSGIINEDGL